MGKFCHLVFVSEDNHNKYYTMTEDNDGQFTVKYGRVDSSVSTVRYPMSKWQSKYNSKVKKGYKDMTEMVAFKTDESGNVEVPNKTEVISNDRVVSEFFEFLKKCAQNTISANYKVSSNKVTQKMVDTAQAIIDELTEGWKDEKPIKQLNELLIHLYTVIPRKMKNVADYLLKDRASKEEIGKLIDKEQKLLDTMAGQVISTTMSNANSVEAFKEEETIDNRTILEKLGLKIELEKDKSVISKIKDLMGESSNLLYKVYKVKNKTTEERYLEYFDSNKNTSHEELLWHGSRNQNWYNIILTGLMIKPSGVITNGSMFGNGIYFANKARKSIGYSSLSGSYWTRGNEDKAFLALFAVNVGNEKKILEHNSDCYNFNDSNIAPYNSVHAYAGRSLLNDEIIIYNTSRCTIRYVIELSR